MFKRPSDRITTMPSAVTSVSNSICLLPL
jgi:hypothetical protein